MMYNKCIRIIFQKKKNMGNARREMIFAYLLYIIFLNQTLDL